MWKLKKAYALAVILTLGLAFALAPRAAADNDGKIDGAVLDFEGKPFAGIGVKIKSEQGATQETKTDADGKFVFVNLHSGKYLVQFQVPNLAQPYEAMAEVHSGGSASVNVNFKEILEKQNPEAAAKFKAQKEDQSKSAGMKEHFNAGVALLDQERAAKAELTKAPADQRSAAKQKVTELSDKAVAEFQEAQKLAGEKDPNRAVFWAQMGEAYDMAGRNDEAVNAYQQAIAAKPDSVSYYNNLGNVLGRMGKIDEARAAYTKCAELDPPNAAMAWRNFGISLYNANRLGDAVEPLQKSAELDPKNAQTWFLLGASLVYKMTMKKVGDKDVPEFAPGTIEAYQEAIKLDPNGTWGQQAKQGLEQLQLMAPGINTRVSVKKKP